MHFLPKETIDNPNALADIFKEMSQAKKGPMNSEQANCTISLMLGNNESVDKMYADLNQHFPLNAFFARCNTMPIKYSKKLLCWLGVLHLDANIGGLLLVGYYLQWFIHDKNIPADKEVTLDFVCEHVFPFGVFSKETIHEFWDKQKVMARPDNLIDHPSACLSFWPQPETV